MIGIDGFVAQRRAVATTVVSCAWIEPRMQMGVARGCTAQAGNEIRIDNERPIRQTTAVQLQQLVISALLVT